MTTMDQVVIENFKRCYTHKLLLGILYKLEIENTELLTAIKRMNIVDVIYMEANEYKEIAIIKSWRKFWLNVKKNNGDNPELNTIQLESIGNNTFLTDLRKLPDSTKMDDC